MEINLKNQNNNGEMNGMWMHEGKKYLINFDEVTLIN